MPYYSVIECYHNFEVLKIFETEGEAKDWLYKFIQNRKINELKTYTNIAISFLGRNIDNKEELEEETKKVKANYPNYFLEKYGEKYFEKLYKHFNRNPPKPLQHVDWYTETISKIVFEYSKDFREDEFVIVRN